MLNDCGLQIYRNNIRFKGFKAARSSFFNTGFTKKGILLKPSLFIVISAKRNHLNYQNFSTKYFTICYDYLI